MAYQLGGVLGAIIVLLIVSQIVHVIVRKIFRKPRKQFHEWITTWIAGPELIALGILCEVIYEHVPHAQAAVLFGVFLQYVGLAIFLIKTIAYIIFRVRRRVSVSPPE